MLILSVVHRSPGDIGRDQNRRNANSDQVEAEGGIDADLTVWAGNLWLLGKRVIVDAAVLVPKDHEQSLFPLRRIAQRFVYVCNEHISQADIVVGMLVICALEGKVEIAGLDETVIWQVPVPGVGKELVEKLKSVLEGISPKSLECEGLGNVVKIDVPGP